MEKKVKSKLTADIENAEKFFDRTGTGIKEAYKCVDSDIDKIDPITSKVNIFLYIPESENDMYPIFLN